MQDLTLKKKFMIGLFVVILVSANTLWGLRLMGKGALFHYLERNHLENVMRIDTAFKLAEQGGKAAEAIRREDLLRYIDENVALARRADSEVFYVEQLIFRLLGFSSVFDIPRKDIEDHQKLAAALRSAPGTGISQEFALGIRPDMVVIIDNSTKFAQLVQEAVAFIKNLVLIECIISMFAVVAIFLLIQRSTLGPLNTALTFAKRVTGGDLTARATLQSRDEIGELCEALNTMNDSLARIVGEVRTGAFAIATATKEVAAGNQDLSERTESQSNSLAQAASNMQELTTTVRKNADNANQANQLVLATSEIAGRGGAVVSQVVSTMDKITESSNKIADIIGVIDGIAFQTNILALNAAVEAARAGDQGRGFAVVAAEVRSLAQRSAAAAKEIKSLITSSTERVQDGSRLVHQAGQTMQEIGTSVKRVTDIMGEITGASQEQRSGIEQINQTVAQMDDVTKQNAALVEQAAAVAHSLEEQSAALARSVSVFTLREEVGGTRAPPGHAVALLRPQR